MTFFAQLLQRSGVVTRDRAIGPRPEPLASISSWSTGAPFSSDVGAAEPAIREEHEERAVRSDDVPNMPSGKTTSAGAASGDGGESESVAAAERLTRRNSSAVPPADSPDRHADERTTTTAARQHPSHAAPAPDVEIVVERTAAPTVSPTASVLPEPQRRSSDALQEARAWTSRTHLPNDQPPRDDRARARAAFPSASEVRQAPRRPAPTSDPGVSELHVHIGTIEVVVEQPPAAPAPTAPPNPARAAGAPPASRRLARHHLRG